LPEPYGGPATARL